MSACTATGSERGSAADVVVVSGRTAAGDGVRFTGVRSPCRPFVVGDVLNEINFSNTHWGSASSYSSRTAGLYSAVKVRRFGRPDPEPLEGCPLDHHVRPNRPGRSCSASL